MRTLEAGMKLQGSTVIARINQHDFIDHGKDSKYSNVAQQTTKKNGNAPHSRVSTAVPETYLTLLNDAPARVMWHVMLIKDTRIKQHPEEYTTWKTLEAEWHKWALVCAAVKGMLFQQSALGIGIRIWRNSHGSWYKKNWVSDLFLLNIVCNIIEHEILIDKVFLVLSLQLDVQILTEYPLL